MGQWKSLCEYSIPFSPYMGKAFGMCGALLIQQIHYWTLKKNHFHEGHYWCYNTYKDWSEQLMGFTPKTIQRTVDELRKQGVVVVGKFNKKKYDKTFWYRVDTQALLNVLSEKYTEKPEIHTN